MRELGIESVRQKAKKNFQKELYAQSNQLHQDFHAEAPNCIWVSNTTEFWYNQKDLSSVSLSICFPEK